MENSNDTTQYAASDIITFSDGIPGFDNKHSFVIVQDEDYAPFEWLVSTDDDSQLKFAMINPLLVYPDYEPDIGPSLIDDLGIEKPEDVLVYVLATIYQDPTKSTVNLMGPIVINGTLGKGKQIILDNSPYTTKEPIIRN